MSIRCGNHEAHTETTYHATTESVRACFDPKIETWACTWLIEIPAGYVPEIEDWVEHRVEECGSLSRHLVDGRGYACESGHEHILCEVRAAERWDYAHDRDEARQLAKVGVDSVDMAGRPWV